MQSAIKENYNENEESVELLIQIWVRFIISFFSLLVFFVDPPEFGMANEAVNKLLISYCLYSACILFVYDMQGIRKFTSIYIFHWIDALFFSILIALTGGAESVYFFFLFFPVIIASFSWGFKEGLKVIIVLVVFYVAITLIPVLMNQRYELSEVLVRPAYLIIFGYMIAYWGGGRITLNRRLNLLRAISTDWSPRFGVNHAMKVNLERLIKFFEASRCIIVLEREEVLPKYVTYSIDRQYIDFPAEPKPIEPSTAKELLNLPKTIAVSYENVPKKSLRSFNQYISYDVNTLESSDRYFRECKLLSSLFDDESFISVPYKHQSVVAGRLFLIAENKEFSRSDVSFTKQVADVIASVIDNMELIENLISEASGQERLRISLDVHDTTIQPYIGLTLALDALAREFNADKHLTGRINEIINMANMTIVDLRSYKDTLREKSLMRGEVLLSAISNQVDRLHRFYGIKVDFTGSIDPNLSGKVAEAAFQIIKEGLSNILRHTHAKKATIFLGIADNNLLIEIGNETDPSSPEPEFMPKSIIERAGIFNGEVSVERNPDFYTIVRILIPIVAE